MNYTDRKSPRADFHDYCGGSYFVTICTRDKKHYFGEINDGSMIYSKMGEICEFYIRDLPSHYNFVEISDYVVMPNHIHMIIHLDTPQNYENNKSYGRSILSVIVGNLKRYVTMYARLNNIDFGWQGRYHDHIIRGFKDGNKISQYIQNNVASWDADCFH